MTRTVTLPLLIRVSVDVTGPNLAAIEELAKEGLLKSEITIGVGAGLSNAEAVAESVPGTFIVLNKKNYPPEPK